MKLGTELNVYYYKVDISPEIMKDSYIFTSLVRYARRRLETLLGHYALSG